LTVNCIIALLFLLKFIFFAIMYFIFGFSATIEKVLSLLLEYFKLDYYEDFKNIWNGRLISGISEYL